MNNMLLISSEWDKLPSFKMMPVNKECPYIECIYSPEQGGTLVIISKDCKESYHMLPKLDDNGDIVYPKVLNGPRNPKMERRLVATYKEYYITNKSEIIDFVKKFAINHSSFDFEKFMTEPSVNVQSRNLFTGADQSIPEMGAPSLVV